MAGRKRLSGGNNPDEFISDSNAGSNQQQESTSSTNRPGIPGSAPLLNFDSSSPNNLRGELQQPFPGNPNQFLLSDNNIHQHSLMRMISTESLLDGFLSSSTSFSNSATHQAHQPQSNITTGPGSASLMDSAGMEQAVAALVTAAAADATHPLHSLIDPSLATNDFVEHEDAAVSSRKTPRRSATRTNSFNATTPSSKRRLTPRPTTSSLLFGMDGVAAAEAINNNSSPFPHEDFIIGGNGPAGVPSSPQDNMRGLRHFSAKVASKVEEKGVTTYNEVQAKKKRLYPIHPLILLVNLGR